MQEEKQRTDEKEQLEIKKSLHIFMQAHEKKCEAIRRYHSEYSVKKMCKVFELKQTPYDQWLMQQKKSAEKRVKSAETARCVGEAFEENGRICGCRKMQRALIMAGLDK